MIGLRTANRTAGALLASLALLALSACDRDRSAASDGRAGADAPVAGVAPSFDCAAASGEVETLICSSSELAELDLRLDSVWTLAMTRFVAGGAPESDVAAERGWQRGWIGGRNECWKSDDVRGCVVEAYRTRIAEIEAGFGLVAGGEPTFWSCEGNPANDFVATFFDTDPPAARIERGDQQEVFLATPAASGSRYVGLFAKEAWFHGREAMFVWPQTDTLTCELR